MTDTTVKTNIIHASWSGNAPMDMKAIHSVLRSNQTIQKNIQEVLRANRELAASLQDIVNMNTRTMAALIPEKDDMDEIDSSELDAYVIDDDE
jgi:hypothetical protein